MPAVVQLRYPEGAEDPQPPDSRLGEDRPRGDARKVAWLLDGQASVPIPPGSYDLVAHRGFRHELAWELGVELAAGQTSELLLELERVVDEPGWVSADLHAHASPSIDGECTVEERLVTVAANEVQLHVATDHDHIADYRPLVESMGLDPWLVTVPGGEVSTNLRGHFNVYPLEPELGEPNGGAPRWWEWQIDTPTLFDTLRDLLGPDFLLQVNHPLDNGMFVHAGYDAATGEPAHEDYYSPDFDTFELLNSGGFEETVELREDLCAHLDQGLRPVAVGVSDTHTRLPGPGHGRTYVQADVDQPDQEDVEAIMDALAGGRAVVSSGPLVLLEASSGDSTAGLGDTLVAEQLSLSIEVQAPSWIPIEQVRLYGAGCELLQAWTVDPEAASAPLWFSEDVEVQPVEDGYYFVEVEALVDMAPAWPGGHPYALTNPIFVELP